VIWTVGVRTFVFVPVPTAALKTLTPPAVSVWGQVTVFVGFTQDPPLHAAAATVVTTSGGRVFDPLVGAVAAIETFQPRPLLGFGSATVMESVKVCVWSTPLSVTPGAATGLAVLSVTEKAVAVGTTVRASRATSSLRTGSAYGVAAIATVTVLEYVPAKTFDGTAT
jgi:hypothetical protein